MSFSRNLSYIIIASSVVVFGLWFSFTNGLRVSGYNQGIEFVKQLKSSGGDENFCIYISIVLFGFAAVLKLLRINHKLAVFELYYLLVAFLLQILFLSLIETGSIRETIILDNNYALFFLLLSLILVPFYVYKNLLKGT